MLSLYFHISNFRFLRILFFIRYYIIFDIIIVVLLYDQIGFIQRFHKYRM